MLEKMKDIIAEQLNADGVEITEATSFKDDLGADSLDLFELVMGLEEEYGVGFKKGNTQLRDQVNDTLKEMAKDGTLAEISEKWFGEDLTIIEA